MSYLREESCVKMELRKCIVKVYMSFVMGVAAWAASYEVVVKNLYALPITQNCSERQIEFIQMSSLKNCF